MQYIDEIKMVTTPSNGSEFSIEIFLPKNRINPEVADEVDQFGHELLSVPPETELQLTVTFTGRNIRGEYADWQTLRDLDRRLRKTELLFPKGFISLCLQECRGALTRKYKYNSQYRYTLHREPEHSIITAGTLTIPLLAHLGGCAKTLCLQIEHPDRW